MRIVATSEFVRVETPKQVLVEMRRVRPDRLAVLDIAVCSRITDRGFDTAPMSLDAAETWARKMVINHASGRIELGAVLLDAWSSHQVLYRSARDTEPVLRGG